MAEIYKAQHEELSSIYVPKTVAQILIDVSMVDDFSRKITILESHIQALEEEMRHIGASKHPLHYSIHFLQDANEILKQEILKCKRSEKNPIVGVLGASESKEINDKKESITSVQLWTTPMHHKSSCEGYQASGSGGNLNHRARAFVPFKSITMKNKSVDPISSSTDKSIDPVSSSTVESEATPNDLNVERKDPQPQKSFLEPLQKKQRRCWSPELHEQFVDALQQLGGVELATPKQIRQVMNVKGLTNNEVKSHLQKYRFYTRKFPDSARRLSYMWPIKDTQFGGAP